MKIFEVSPFFNEKLILKLKIENSLGVVDELHVTESNRSHKYLKKPFFLDKNIKNLIVHKIDGDQEFIKRYMLKKQFPFFCKYKYAMHNEGTQRSYLDQFLKNKLNDKDILISSDLDELLDFRKFDFILDSTKKHGILTVNCYETMYFFNLFNFEKKKQIINARNWSYRIFIMTGKAFKDLKLSLHNLRFKGVMNQLKNEIHCLKGYYGFHHSWLPPEEKKYSTKTHEKSIINKLKNYSHFNHELNLNILKKYTKHNRINFEKIVNDKKSFLQNSYLSKNEEIELLPEVNKLKKKYPHLFFQ